MVEVAGLVLSEQQVKQVSHVAFGQLQGHALVQEHNAAAQYGLLLGKTWTGKVLEAAA